MGALLMFLGLVFIGVSFPADGLTGVTLALAGLGLLWSGFFTRRDGAK
ncbi:hypothetical protein [Streptomyces chattanoogensis]|nr:hypothetical protein [Streptomyces chattanoogensis]